MSYANDNASTFLIEVIKDAVQGGEPWRLAVNSLARAGGVRAVAALIEMYGETKHVDSKRILLAAIGEAGRVS